MGKREYKLPDYDELNKEQDKVLELPKDGQFFIVGGPGTGKSVVALLRVLKYQKDNNYLFLTFNHVLNEATKQVSNTELNSDTAQSWFYKLQFELAPGHPRYDYETKKMPEKENHKPDYHQVIRRFETIISNEPNKIKSTDMLLIIDEGQDMPVGFYEAIQTLGYENFFIVADQNQQITEDHSSREELTDVLALEVEDVIELTQNYRNTSQIAKLAEYFFTDKSSPKPDLPNKDSIEIPILYEYELVNNCVEMILNDADRNSDKLIGLFVATETKREDYVKKLLNTDIARDNEKPIVETYSSDDVRLNKKIDIDFSHSGIVVLNDKSVKGIEFDIVYIVLDGFKLYNNDHDVLKKRFYVMCSRAKEKLIILKSKIHSDKVDTIFPDDESILIRDNI